MYRRMTLIGILTAVASMLVFSIANALPSTSTGLQTAVTTDTSISETSMSDTSMPDTSAPDSSTPAPSSTETSVVDPAVVGATTYVVVDAGSVTIDYDGSTLSLLSADANASWTAFSEQTAGREIEVEFIRGDRRVKFNAELEDGGIRIRVRDETKDSDTTVVTTDTTLVDDSTDTTDTSMITNTTIDDDDDDDDDHGSNRGSDDDHDDDDDDDDDNDDSNRGSDDDDDDHDDDHGDDD